MVSPPQFCTVWCWSGHPRGPRLFRVVPFPLFFPNLRIGAIDAPTLTHSLWTAQCETASGHWYNRPKTGRRITEKKKPPQTDADGAWGNGEKPGNAFAAGYSSDARRRAVHSPRGRKNTARNRRASGCATSAARLPNRPPYIISPIRRIPCRMSPYSAANRLPSKGIRMGRYSNSVSGASFAFPACSPRSLAIPWAQNADPYSGLF